MKKIKVLIVSKDAVPGMDLVAQLKLSRVNITVVDQVLQALKNIKRYAYDIIILDDRLNGGTTYDVAMGILSLSKNSNVPVVCTGQHQGRLYKLTKVLGSRAVVYDKNTVQKLKRYLSQEDKEAV